MTRPQDLLHKIGFDFALIPSYLHPKISGVQITLEESGGLLVDIQFSILQKMKRFKKYDVEGWIEIKDEAEEEEL
jgi:hypothetical protein